jgi:hypothetical protein
LQLTQHEEIRFCDHCREFVFYCTSIDEAKEHARQGHCVAVDPGLSRIPGDLAEEEGDELVLGEFMSGVEDLPMEEPRRDLPLRPKKRWWKFW